MPLVAPNLLAADLAWMADEAAAVAGAPGEGADLLHIDVMDAHFVPNLTVGLPVVESLLRHTTIPLDCHLMIDDPDRWAIRYAEAGVHNVTVHVEAARDPVAIAEDIHAAGAHAGLAFSPQTLVESYLETLRHYDTLLLMSVEPGLPGQRFRPDALGKVRTARLLIDQAHLELLIEIEGDIDARTIGAAAAAGAECFVVGSAIFAATDRADAVRTLRARATAASTGR